MNIQAARAFGRALATSPRIRAKEESHYYDRQFDAGEWSDSYHGEVLQDMYDDIARQVAAAYGMPLCDLLHDYDYWCNETAYRVWQAHARKE